MKTVQMISANGGAEIEVNDDRVEHFEHFERKGYRLVDATAPAPRSRQPKAPKADASEEK